MQPDDTRRRKIYAPRPAIVPPDREGEMIMMVDHSDDRFVTPVPTTGSSCAAQN
jgi:hypothetical protein